MSLTEQDFAALAEVAVRVGVNLQPGQRLSVNASILHAPTVRAVAQAAYRAGARDVRVDFHDEGFDRLRLIEAPEEGLREFPQWLADGMKHEVKAGTAFLSIIGSDPDLLAGVPAGRIAMSLKARQEAMGTFRLYQRRAWSIIAAPSPAWAAKVFPGKPAEIAMDLLWQAMQKACRVDGTDPVGAWHTHVQGLQARARWLDELQIARLHYLSSSADLEIALPPTHQWVTSGQSRSVGYPTSPNIPTEEIFTAPLRTGVNGTVKSTKPLSHAGQLIEGIAFTFKDGRIVSYAAARGQEALREVIETDQGSHFLGEVALVPIDSPISLSGILYYNTLFDEKASCHLAIGSSSRNALTDGSEVHTDQDLLRKGANASITHVDFMIGSHDLTIDADTTDGQSVPIFRQGTWASPI